VSKPIVLLKLGDPGSNYYPTPEQERAIRRAFETALIESGTEATVITSNWALNVEVIHLPDNVPPVPPPYEPREWHEL